MRASAPLIPLTHQIDSTFPSIYLVAPSGVPCAGDANCEVITLSPIRRHKRSDVPSVQPSVQPRRWDPRDSMCFRAPIHPPLPAVTSSLTAPPPEWRGKILRVRAWVRDGFWVRAQMVLKQALWATVRGIPFFVDLHGGENVTCGSTRGTARACDAYAGPLINSDGWSSYFEPLTKRAAIDSTGVTPKVVEMDCVAAAYYCDSDIYPMNVDLAQTSRLQMSRLVAQWLRVRPKLLAQANKEWTSQILRPDPRPGIAVSTLGVHVRGSDKFILPRVDPAAYYPLIDAFLATHPNPRIVLATDDANYARRVVQRYGASVVRQQRGGEYLVRDSRGGAMWKMRTKLYRAHLMGVQVLLDTLLLSRCDYLLKAASAVSEFAIYFSPRLINNSFDFQIPSPNHPRVGDRMYLRPSLPEWAARLGWSNLSVLDADQQPLQLPPKYRDGPLADEAWTDGFCGVTKVGRSAEEDCDERDRGAVPLRRLPPPHDQQALAVWNGGWRSGGGWGDRGIVLLTAIPCRRLASNFVFIVAAAVDT